MILNPCLIRGTEINHPLINLLKAREINYPVVNSGVMKRKIAFSFK